MNMLPERDREILRERLLDSMVNDVSVTMFSESLARTLLTIPGQSINPLAHTARNLATEIEGLSPKIRMRILDFRGDGAELAQSMNITRVPAYILGDDPEGRLRFYGTPMGNELPTIVETLEEISQNKPKLNPETITALQENITSTVHIQVFVTPT
jgi:alkyl hydroperoxide reductase subunit AhpF